MARYLPVLMLSLAACGTASEPIGRSENTPPTPAVPTLQWHVLVESDLHGARFEPKDAVFAEGMFGGMQPGVLVLMSDAPGLCEHARNNSMPRNHTFVGLGFARNDGEAPVLGTYSAAFDRNEALYGQLVTTDAECGQTQTLAAFGSAELAEYVPGETLRARFSVGFAEDDAPFTGSMKARACDAPALLEAGGFVDPTCTD